MGRLIRSLGVALLVVLVLLSLRVGSKKNSEDRHSKDRVANRPSKRKAKKATSDSAKLPPPPPPPPPPLPPQPYSPPKAYVPPQTVCTSPPPNRAACATTGAFSNNGAWVRGDDNDPLLTVASQQRGMAWPANDTQRMQDSSARIYDWKWEAACPICKYQAITKRKFCDIVAPYRRVFFVGDSVQGQLASTMASYVGGPERDYQKVTKLNHKNKPYPHDNEWNVCGKENDQKPTRITYLRDDFLWSEHNVSMPGTITIKRKANSDRVTNVNWLQDPDIYNASEDLIIMSAGPHYHDLEAFTHNADRLAGKMALHLKTIATGKPKPIVYRYSVTGHPKCDKYKEPFTETDLEGMWNMVEASEGLKKRIMDVYTWHLMSVYNTVAVKAFSAHDVHPLYFDIETASKLRPDTHNPNECLHLKMPGLMDMWIVWLLNYLDCF